MIRTQISLTGEQYESLRKRASRDGVSMSALIRQGIDRVLADDERLRNIERALKALEEIKRRPKRKGPRTHVAENHDRYFADAIAAAKLRR